MIHNRLFTNPTQKVLKIIENHLCKGDNKKKILKRFISKNELKEDTQISNFHFGVDRHFLEQRCRL
jgi:hypothetical protein